MKILLTGGAGFIGSCILGMLNREGIDDVILVDNINSSEKWLNIRNKKYSEYYHKDEFLEKLFRLHGITHIIHMGACSATTEKDFDYLYKNNFEYTRVLWEYAKENQISFLYASSAATYGDGQYGFDDKEDISRLLPLNRYGYSKQIFDLWQNKQIEKPKQVVGMKFFNVYGPNEYAKGSMASVVFHGYNQIMKDGEIRLFKSYKDGYEDGGQLRDFVYVKDICKIVWFFMNNPEVNGLFNLGTGNAETFNSLAEATFKALRMKTNIRYVDMPSELRLKYQYNTKAEIQRLRDAGYSEVMTGLEEGIMDYVCEYLMKDFNIY